MKIKEIQEEIVDEFSMFDDWMERYEYIIELGKKLPLIKEEFKTDNNLIKGCQSKVWLQGEQNDDKIVFTADSDAILTKGIIAIFCLSISFYMMKTTTYTRALGDYVLEFIGLKSWSGEFSGMHLTVIYFGILTIILLYVVLNFTVGKCRIRKIWTFLLVIIFVCFDKYGSFTLSHEIIIVERKKSPKM